MTEHYARIYRHVLALVHDPAEAEDLTQETFLRAHARRASLRDGAAVVPWLYSIATHAALDRQRLRTRAAIRDSGLDPDDVPVADGAPAPETRPQRAEMSACVQQRVDRLSGDYRTVLNLHDVQGLTAAEAAEQLGDSVGSVKIRLHRARARLRSSLERDCEFSQDECGTLVCEPKPE